MMLRTGVWVARCHPLRWGPRRRSQGLWEKGQAQAGDRKQQRIQFPEGEREQLFIQLFPSQGRRRQALSRWGHTGHQHTGPCSTYRQEALTDLSQERM